ncbi:MAG: hypothetical protein WC879_17325 [Melioribacteraceae bacterium]
MDKIFTAEFKKLIPLHIQLINDLQIILDENEKQRRHLNLLMKKLLKGYQQFEEDLKVMLNK